MFHKPWVYSAISAVIPGLGNLLLRRRQRGAVQLGFLALFSIVGYLTLCLDYDGTHHPERFTIAGFLLIFFLNPLGLAFWTLTIADTRRAARDKIYGDIHQVYRKRRRAACARARERRAKASGHKRKSRRRRRRGLNAITAACSPLTFRSVRHNKSDGALFKGTGLRDRNNGRVF